VILVDVNVFVYASRIDSPDHDRYRAWLDAVLSSDEPFGVSSIVMSGFVRVVTHPKVFQRPSTSATAFAFANAIRSAPNAVAVEPGARHWGLFERLCEEAGAKGNLVPDAYLAALAIESGSEWITTDRDFARFPGLRWRHPLRTS
jgi:uncharacterized protein